MKRREFMTLLAGVAAAWPLAARAQLQAQPPPNQAPHDNGAAQATARSTDRSVGQIATLQGSATVTRRNNTIALKIADAIFESDALQTALNSSLGVTFDDETTFSLSANTRIVVDKFVYQDGGSGNAASFNVASGTAAFVASLVAKTGDMKITTDSATLGIRGTTGVVDVTQGASGAPTIKLYPDSDGHVGQIEVFDRQGGRLGALTQGASAFALRPGAGGRIAAVPYQIPPQEAARDRGVLARLNLSHAVGRQMVIQRQRLRTPNQPRQNNQRPGGRGNNGRPPREEQNPRRFPGGPQNNGRPPGRVQPFNRAPRGGNPTPPKRPGPTPPDRHQ